MLNIFVRGICSDNHGVDMNLLLVSPCELFYSSSILVKYFTSIVHYMTVDLTVLLDIELLN